MFSWYLVPNARPSDRVFSKQCCSNRASISASGIASAGWLPAAVEEYMPFVRLWSPESPIDPREGELCAKIPGSLESSREMRAR